MKRLFKDLPALENLVCFILEFLLKDFKRDEDVFPITLPLLFISALLSIYSLSGY